MKRKARKSNELRGGCLSLFGLPFLLAGLGVTVFYFVGLVGWWEARVWVETPCMIVQAELKVNHGDESTTYQAVGRYVYVWDGEEYESDKISFSSGSDNVGDFHERVHAEMKRRMREYEGVGTCYVNPVDPSEAVLVRDFRPEQSAFFSIFCLIFPLVGGGLVMGGWHGERRAKATRELQIAQPDKPWLTNPDWLQNPMPETGMRVGRFAIPAALWLLLVTVPMLATGAASGVFANPSGWWMAVPGGFFLAGLWMILHGLREAMRIGRVGLVLDSLPLRPGCEASGVWVTAKPLRPLDAPVLKILCKETVTTRSGGETSTQTTTIWEQEESLDVAAQTRDVVDYRLPFRFRLPANVRPTEGGEDSSKIDWKLEFRIPGSSVKSEFEVPVMRMEGDEIPVEDDRPVEERMDDAMRHLPELLDRAKLHADFEGERLVSLRCTARRWRSSIVFLSIFDLIWTGAAVFLVLSDAPIIFQVVWPFSAAALWLLVIHQLVSRKEMRIVGPEMMIRSRSLLGTKEERLLAEDVIEFSHASNTQVGNTKYYALTAEVLGSRKLVLADGIAGEQAVLGLRGQLEIWRAGHSRR